MRKHFPGNYRSYFSERKFWSKIKKMFSVASQKALYSALLLYYAFQQKETPLWAKNIILGTLGYLISPIDAIPDLTPILGYTDDLGVLAFGLVTVAAFVGEEARENAREKMKSWFGELDMEGLAEVDKKL